MRLPLLEFDPGDGVLVPKPPHTTEPLARSVVLCFFSEVLRQWEHDGRLRPIGSFSDEVGGARIYRCEPDSSLPVIVFHPGMGGPLASHCLETVIAAGLDRVVSVGGAGALSPAFAQDDVLVINEAIRDEGTSYHYLPAARSVVLDPAVASEALHALAARQIPCRAGKTWTTDADFRETRQKIQSRIDEGCLAVEMESASLAAVCAFRGVEYGHLIYAGDALHNSDWDGRGWTTSGRRSQLLEVALRIAGSRDPGLPPLSAAPADES